MFGSNASFTQPQKNYVNTCPLAVQINRYVVQWFRKLKRDKKVSFQKSNTHVRAHSVSHAAFDTDDLPIRRPVNRFRQRPARLGEIREIVGDSGDNRIHASTAMWSCHIVSHLSKYRIGTAFPKPGPSAFKLARRFDRSQRIASEFRPLHKTEKRQKNVTLSLVQGRGTN